LPFGLAVGRYPYLFGGFLFPSPYVYIIAVAYYDKTHRKLDVQNLKKRRHIGAFRRFLETRFLVFL